MRERWPRASAAVLISSLLFAPASPSHAQAGPAGLGSLEDASTPPRGLLRLRAMTAWTRYDSRFTVGGVEPLGARLTADSLGGRQLPALSSIQSLVQSASGNPFTLSLGRSRLNAMGREEIIPIALEYGLTSRFAVGVLMPIVRKRAAVLFRLDTTGSAANVGPNPRRTSTTATTNNTQVQAEFTNAITQLQNKLQSCQTNPAAPGCASVVGREALALQLIQSSQSFASALASLYGSASATGMAFVPVSKSAAQDSIAARVSAFNTRYKDFLGTTANLLQAVPSAAGGPAGPAEFQSYLVADLGRDSLNMQERVGIGDVEVGFKALLLDVIPSARRRTGVQLGVASAVRLPTGSRQSKSDVVDLRLGEGRVVVDSRAVFDGRAGRFGLVAAGDFATSVHDNDTTNATTRDSRWTEIQIAPRWHFSEPLAIHATYSLRSADRSGGDQLVGGGVSYSTLSAFRAGRSGLPMEMRFTHLEAVSGDANRPKYFRDPLEIRIYFRLR
jgi:hypothetical protein